MDLPRQPGHVLVVLSGDPRDVEFFKSRLMSMIEHNSYDLATSSGPDRFTISPHAVND